MTHELKINKQDIEIAFSTNDYNITVYLDSHTGQIIYLSDDDEFNESQNVDSAQILEDTENRYLPIPRQDSRDGYEDMEDFIRTVSDNHVRELLEIAITGKGAFRRFKDAVHRYPKVSEAWYKFSEERQQRRIQDWLESNHIHPIFE